jgi:acetyltransferase
MVTVTPPEGERDAWRAAEREVGSVLEPDTVAVVGASSTPGKPGYALVKNVLENGFEGSVYPINPDADEILGEPAYPSVTDVPGDIDTVLFAVPAPVIKEILPECAEKGVTSAVIVSAGFAEAVTEDGAAAQAELVELCEEYGIRAIGPNTTGMISKKADLLASFIPFPKWYDGTIAMGAQTGCFAGVYMEELMARETQTMGYNYSLGFGNKMDLDETDFVRYAGQDDDVEVIQLYLEEIARPEEFFPAAARVGEKKPIVLLKSGRTAEGRAAARYHTGSRPAPEADVEAACRASGIVRAENVQEFMNYAKAFDYQPAPRGRNVAVLSFSGANAVMAADYVSNSSLELADLTDETLEAIKAQVPEWQPVRNPVDQWLALPNGSRTAHEVPLDAVLDDPNVDAVVTIHLATETTAFEEFGEVFAEARERHPEKPILSYVMGADVKQQFVRDLEDTDVPVFEYPYAAIDALDAMYRWRRYADGYEDYDRDVPGIGKTI